MAALLLVAAALPATASPSRLVARTLVPRPPDAPDQDDVAGDVFAEAEPVATLSAPPDPVPANAASFVTFPVYATQYEPIGDPASVEVALPDLCVKFAARGDAGALALHNCPAGYSPDLDYRVVVTVEDDDGASAVFPVRDVGPWNVDDNYWNGPDGPRPRRAFNNLPTGQPEAAAGANEGYNEVVDCWDMKQLVERPGPADQFKRCLVSPAGIDLSLAAAARLGLAPGVNTHVLVTFLWEPRAPAPPT